MIPRFNSLQVSETSLSRFVRHTMQVVTVEKEIWPWKVAHRGFEHTIKVFSAYQSMLETEKMDRREAPLI